MKYLILFFICMAAGRESLAQAPGNQAQQLNKTLATITERLKAYGDFTPEDAAENSYILHLIPEFNALESNADSVWRSAAAELPSVAPTELSKTILFQSFRGLSPDSYINFLVSATDDYDQKQVSKFLLDWAIFPRGKLEGLLAYNYEDPRVQSLIQRWRAIFVGDAKLQEGFDEILSGKSKKWQNDYRVGNPGAFANVPIPKVGSSTAINNDANPAGTPEYQQSQIVKPQPTPKASANQGIAASPESSHWLLLTALATVGLGGIGYFIVRRRKPNGHDYA